jgi:hypothetical protein
LLNPATMHTVIRRTLPQPMKRWLKTSWKEVLLYRALSSIEPGIMPTDESLFMLAEGWGNQGFAAKTDYLRQVAKLAATTESPILECGSGLTTLLLGRLAGRRGVEIWSLEHISEWCHRVNRTLERYRLPVNCVHAPLVDHGEFDWYDVPANLPKFSLVICDGPPANTRGGRYGLLPILHQRLSGAKVLLDDASRPNEQAILERWRKEVAADISISDTYATVKLG